ncbi:MAG: tRNA (adenosine(37)-N6)-threonylcarbamoyltransferase complex transferase subunit TsaD [Candidatus Omnitrophica bacterium]|nr:tRNA (adenosine(37)-N6)-threonylcarbamoyltransferase complex transferase subunit TsaD [Candidatus Omnitrophota bacterium]MBD3268717.1 tRNA (adenosine(37)-N6)-threonylcarbamoyltransferase complex transferase subunit TsaD [Candidatus Omnitrophota bacterium]
MVTLGIETSCDETSCAVLDGYSVLSNVTVSSLKEHRKYGGVVPEIATRSHLRNIDKVLGEACERASLSLGRIDLIAVTVRPGLIGSLLIGVNFAKSLSFALGRPLIGINHLHAHAFAPFLNGKEKLDFPLLGLVISGGHTEIYRIEDFNKIKILGRTRDDACGEVFDKVAKYYGLGYPGGPVIDRLFNERYKREFKFKCGKIGYDLSFSGIKTALIYKKKEMEERSELTAGIKKRLLSSFQYTALEKVIQTVLEAVDRTGIKRVACGGGVVANKYLRKRFGEKREKADFLLSPLEYTGDNAAMVAGLGFYLYNKKGLHDNLDLKAGTE